MAIIPIIPPNGEETAQDSTIALAHDPTTGPPAITTGTEDRPVTLGDISDIMTHSMREFQHSIQQMVTQQIETQIQSAIPIPLVLPSSSQLQNNQNARSLPTQPRRSAPLNADLLDAQMLTSFPQTASSVRISRLPTRLLGQIARSEFVNFDSLLTASTSGIADPPMTVTVQQGSESSQAVCLSQQQKPKIHDFGSWLAAWNIYLTSYAHYHAYMTPQLLQYQTAITRFSQSYPVAAWRAYNMQFRQSRANDCTLRWDVIDEIIATDVLRTFVQMGNIATTSSIPITCYRCRRTGHIAAQCFTNMGDNQGGGTGRNYYRPIDTTHNNIRHNMVP